MRSVALVFRRSWQTPCTCNSMVVGCPLLAGRCPPNLGITCTPAPRGLARGRWHTAHEVNVARNGGYLALPLHPSNGCQQRDSSHSASQCGWWAALGRGIERLALSSNGIAPASWDGGCCADGNGGLNRRTGVCWCCHSVRCLIGHAHTLGRGGNSSAPRSHCTRMACSNSMGVS